MRNPASPCCPCSSRSASTCSATPPRRVLPALVNRPNGQRHRSARHQSIGQRGVALNREALVQALSGLIGRRGGFTMSIVAWVTLDGAGVPRDDSTCCALPLVCDFADNSLVQIVCRRFPLGQRDSQDRKRRGVAGVTPPPPQGSGRCLGVSGTGSRRIEYPTTLVRGCSRDEHSPMSGVCLTHRAAQAVHALRSGRPRAQGGWVKASCLVREGVPTDRRHAALKQRTTHRLRGTEDER